MRYCLLNIIADGFQWLCSKITNILFNLITALESLCKGLAGLPVDSSATGTSWTDKVGATTDNQNLIVQLFRNETVVKLMSSLLLFGIVVLVLCVILAIIRNIYKDDSKVTISSIMGQAIKAVIGFILVPALCLIGVMVSNEILIAVNGATNAAGTASFAAGIYQACNDSEQSVNIFQQFSDSAQRSQVDKEDEDSESSMHMATIVYAQYLWQMLTENYYYDGTNVKSRQDSRTTSGNGTGSYIDVLGLMTKPKDGECLYIDKNGNTSDENARHFSNGDGIDGIIDTGEDVQAFYEVLLSQYTVNFPKAEKTEKGKFIKVSIDLTGSKDRHFNAGEKKVGGYMFDYYYYGECIFSSENYAKNKYIVPCYESLKANNTFEKNSWTFQKTNSQWTNENLNTTLGMGDDINYFYALIVAILVAKALASICFGLAKRIVQLVIYYVLSPIALALYPFDNGKAFGSWKSDFVGYTVGAYGAIAGVNLVIQIMPIIKKINIFSSTTLSNIARLIFYIILAQSMESLVKLLSGWIGGKDLLAEGKSTAQTATAPVKKIASTAGRVVGTAVGTAWGIGIAARKGGDAKKTLANLAKMSDADKLKEAQDAGYSTTEEYEEALKDQQKAGSLGGQIKAGVGKVWQGTKGTFASTSLGQTFLKNSGFLEREAEKEAAKAKDKKKTSMQSAYEKEFASGTVTANLGKNMQSKLDALGDAFSKASAAFRDASKNLPKEVDKRWGQLSRMGIDESQETNVKKFIRTGDVSGLGGLTAKQQKLAQDAREEYLRSSAYTKYSVARDEWTGAKKAYESYNVSGAANLSDAMVAVSANLDQKAYVTAQKLGDTDEQKRLVVSAMAAAGMTGGSAVVDDIVNGISAELQKSSEATKKAVQEAGEKAKQKVMKMGEAKPPKK